MKIDLKIIKRLEELLARGNEVLSTKRNPPPKSIGFDASVDSQLVLQWATSVQNILIRVFGKDSEHYKNFSKQLEKKISYSPAYRAQGVLKAAKDDYENEWIFEIKELIEAELFDDFLGQAMNLVEAGYYQPAAVIAGAVLEDGLRKLCVKQGIPLGEKPKLGTMNSELAKSGTYNKLTQKRITALTDIRNNAAHGQWNEFCEKDVKDAIDWINQFMESNYT